MALCGGAPAWAQAETAPPAERIARTKTSTGKPANITAAKARKPVSGSLSPSGPAAPGLNAISPGAFHALSYAATPDAQSLAPDGASGSLANPTGFYADLGGQGRASSRRARNSGATLRVLPYVGIGYGDSFSADTMDGAWAKVGSLGNFGFGPAITLDRRVTVPTRTGSHITDMFGSAKAGAFLNYQQNGEEWGRITFSAGTPILGSEPGFDLKMTRTFSLGDTVMVSLGPTLSFNDYKRTDLVAPQFTGTKLAATGATFQLEKELSRNFTATLSANYALLHPAPNSSAQVTPGGRNRYDFGITLTRRFGLN